MPRIGELTEEAVEATALAADLRDGTVSWQQWNPDLTCSGRQEAATEEAAQAAAEAWEALEAAEAEEAARGNAA
jgi:hypothetical protein